MKVLKEAIWGEFDLAVYGLGYESRSTSIFSRYKESVQHSLALGYQNNTDVLFYQNNKSSFLFSRSIFEKY